MSKEKVEIELPDSMTSVGSGLATALRKAPEMLTMLIMLAGFFWYLHDLEKLHQREDARLDALSELRSEYCHKVQENAIEAMNGLSQALQQQTKVFSELRMSIEELRRTVEDLEERVNKN